MISSNFPHSNTNPKKLFSVVILDEIDFLITRDQDILYKLFEWPCLENSNMVLIGIANALDMTSRFLPRLKAKQCKNPKTRWLQSLFSLSLISFHTSPFFILDDPQLLNFRPYEVDEIKEIILERLKIARNSSNDTDDNDMNTITNVEVQSSSTTASAPPEFIMQPSAVEFCARKLVGMGDLRKTLDICRRAIEVAEAEHRQKEKEEEDYKKQMKQDTNNSNDTNTTVTDTNQTQSLPSVTVKHVMQVANAALGSISSNATAVRESTTHQKIALIALLLLERGKKEDLNLGKVFSRHDDQKFLVSFSLSLYICRYSGKNAISPFALTNKIISTSPSLAGSSWTLLHSLNNVV